MTVTGLSKQMHLDTVRDAILRTCGVARTGVSVRVVDEHDRDIPVGEVGEVLTRRDCVMSGYLNSPETTAQALRGGWLHTGDLGV
jgi:long-chain acyl-CoA synthetase